MPRSFSSTSRRIIIGNMQQDLSAKESLRLFNENQEKIEVDITKTVKIIENIRKLYKKEQNVKTKYENCRQKSQIPQREKNQIVKHFKENPIDSLCSFSNNQEKNKIELFIHNYLQSFVSILVVMLQNSLCYVDNRGTKAVKTRACQVVQVIEDSFKEVTFLMNASRKKAMLEINLFGYLKYHSSKLNFVIKSRNTQQAYMYGLQSIMKGPQQLIGNKQVKF